MISLMGKLAQFGKVAVRIFGNDHPPPHFHVTAPDFRAIVAIDTLEVLAGQMPRDVLETISTWARANRNALIADWNAYNPGLAVD